jgi:two-component system sensor histidine kinase CreC
VAAPIKRGDELIGVVSVGKPSVAVQPFVERALTNIREKGALMLLATLALGMLITHWLTFSIRKLTAFAQAVREGARPVAPKLGEKELAQLADAMDAMRRELEGKDYVENYLHNLTHELKSPLAAIQGTAELLDEQLPAADRERFIRNIQREASRLREVVEQLLRLASVEKQLELNAPQALDTQALIENLCEERQWRVGQKDIRFVLALSAEVKPVAERFLLYQALGNLLDNAIDFSPPGSVIKLQTHSDAAWWRCTVEDQGPGIPEFALERVFERFYSLPRPEGGARSSGLGLSFVQEAARLHGGQLRLANRPQGGVKAEFRLPLAEASTQM